MESEATEDKGESSIMSPQRSWDDPRDLEPSHCIQAGAQDTLQPPSNDNSFKKAQFFNFPRWSPIQTLTAPDVAELH
jgi:hypothetical protein